MSRLIVKNLPKNITDARLKEHFAQKGLVTDVQLKYTKNGTFRQFAFVGFKTVEQANAAKEYFDNTFIDTSRISIDTCTTLGDPSKPRAWSKYAPDSSYYASGENNNAKAKDEVVEKEQVDWKKETKNIVQKEIQEAMEKHKNDPLFMEFLESHASKELKEVWRNDGAILDATKFELSGDNSNKNGKTAVEVAASGDRENEMEKEGLEDDEEEDSCEDNREEEDDQREKTDKAQKKIANKVISDLEYMEALKKKEQNVETGKEVVEKKGMEHGPAKFFTVKLQGLGYKHKKKDVKQFFRPLKVKSIRLPPKIKGIAYVGFKTEQHLRKALLKNKSFLEGKQIFVSKYEGKQDSKVSEESNVNIKWKKQEETLKNEESIAESGRMFIRNLPYATTEDELRKLFEKYGPMVEVSLPIDRTTRKTKGFGTVTFMMPEHAVKAYTELDGTIFEGRMLHLLPGKAKPDQLQQNNENLTYKQKKELEAKASAGSSHNWNTLFLGQNAIADAIAATYNTTKEKVLEDGTKGLSAAVKLALGETQLVQNTRNFLEENGVFLDAFNQPPEKRSKTVILIKNLPVGTPAEDIRELFKKHGVLGRVVMPPSGITALVEFLEPFEARQAFTKLAYTKYKHLPLYLEWAPENSFVGPPTAKKTENVLERKEDRRKETEEEHSQKPGEVKRAEEIAKKEESDKEENEDDEEEPEPDTTLFVKNVNFATTEEQLKQYFGKCGKIHYVTIATKKDPKNANGKLSMGYGFVRFKRKQDADRALKTLQMTVLDGKTLELKRSERILTTDVKTAKKTSKTLGEASTKILIRNVPFQATAEEITELFKAFGELKGVRLPRKFTGVEKHRGFAFVEYYTKTEAKKAFKALCQSTHLYGRRLVLEWAATEEGVEEIRKRTAKHFHQEHSSKRNKRSTLNPEDVGLAEDPTRVNSLR